MTKGQIVPGNTWKSGGSWHSLWALTQLDVGRMRCYIGGALYSVTMLGQVKKKPTQGVNVLHRMFSNPSLFTSLCITQEASNLTMLFILILIILIILFNNIWSLWWWTTYFIPPCIWKTVLGCIRNLNMLPRNKIKANDIVRANHIVKSTALYHSLIWNR